MCSCDCFCSCISVFMTSACCYVSHRVITPTQGTGFSAVPVTTKNAFCYSSSSSFSSCLYSCLYHLSASWFFCILPNSLLLQPSVIVISLLLLPPVIVVPLFEVTILGIFPSSDKYPLFYNQLQCAVLFYDCLLYTSRCV